MRTIKYDIPTADRMIQFGRKLAHACREPIVIYLIGELGAGKTTLVRGFLQGLGHKGSVKSPTYTVVEPYKIAGKSIYHLDLYRLSDPEELEYIGIRDYFSGNAFCLVEWPERGTEFLPQPDILCKIHIKKNGSGRSVKLIAKSDKGEKLLDCLKNSKNID